MGSGKYKKYPRTYHLPWSKGYTSDDKVLRSLEAFIGKEVVVTEKLDGENTSIYRDHIHARSLDSKDHSSRHWIKSFMNVFSYDIPEGWRICGENVFAKHSIYYSNLSSYFYMFSIWNEENICLSWDETVEWSKLLGLETVPVLYRGEFSESVIKELYTGKSVFGGEQEGYVVRVVDRFSYEAFESNVGKYVRENHVQTDKHWLNKEVEQNGLID